MRGAEIRFFDALVDVSCVTRLRLIAEGVVARGKAAAAVLVAACALAALVFPCSALADEGCVFACAGDASSLKEDFAPDLEIVPDLEESFAPDLEVLPDPAVIPSVEDSFAPDLEVVEDPEGGFVLALKGGVGLGGIRVFSPVEISIVVPTTGFFAVVFDAIEFLLRFFI